MKGAFDEAFNQPFTHNNNSNRGNRGRGRGNRGGVFPNSNRGAFNNQSARGAFNSTRGSFNQSNRGSFKGAFNLNANAAAFTPSNNNVFGTPAFGSPANFNAFNVDSKPNAFKPQVNNSPFEAAKPISSILQTINNPFETAKPKAFTTQTSHGPFEAAKPKAFIANPTKPNRGAFKTTVSTPFQFQRKKETMLESSSNSKITNADRAARFGSTSKSVLYDQFKENRVTERQKAIENGDIPDPNNPRRLEDAIDFRGTCQTKCPEFEMLEREIQNGLDSLEMDENGNVDPEKAVKAYRRSAAGVEQPLPSDVRSEEALLETLDYLIDHVLSKYPLEKCHAFVRDRTRSIRQDFTLQNIRDIAAVQVHERIARFHILCLHEMCELDEGKFSKQQETEQLRKVLVSLMEFYDDLREEGIETENEAEFRAYNIISHIRDQDIARQAMTLPVYLFKSAYITRALEFRALSQRNNEIMETPSRRNKPENVEACQNLYSAFFKLIADPGTTFLMACMLETHFADVRKGALKAMNVSYFMKAGGVPAEDVRQILAYDTLKQLFEEVHLYGIIIDNSLDGPTFSFGQKHCKTKIPFFVEPLSNPAQRKSLLLVEPKKAGRTFADIINGINPNATPLPNQNVFARQGNPVKATASVPIPGALTFKPTATASPSTKFTDLTNNKGNTFPNNNIKQQKEAEEQLEMVRSKAAAVEAMAARERKKMEALEEKQKLEAVKKEEAKRLEAERVQKEKEKLLKQQEQEEKKKLQRAEALAKEEQEKKIAEMHKNVIKSQLSKRWIEEILEKVIKEKSEALLRKAYKQRKLLKKLTTPWLTRARSAIKKRTTRAMERRRQWQFSNNMIINNPYISAKSPPPPHHHSSLEGTKERVQHSIIAEKIALENNMNDEEAVWKMEEFPLCIYPRIRDKMMQLKEQRLKGNDTAKPSWQLVIDAVNLELHSSVWFKRKFGLENTFNRKDGLYQAFDVIIRLITPHKEVSCQIANEVGAIIFSLPESKSDKTNDEFATYWEINKQRLDDLTAIVEYYNPGSKVPFLFTYFPDSSSTESTLEKIPKLLGLENNRLVSDYHLLVMNPLTISTRIIHEVNWLSNNTVINQ